MFLEKLTILNFLFLKCISWINNGHSDGIVMQTFSLTMFTENELEERKCFKKKTFQEEDCTVWLSTPSLGVCIGCLQIAGKRSVQGGANLCNLLCPVC